MSAEKKDVPVGFRITATMKEQLTALAEKENRDFSNLMFKICNDYIDGKLNQAGMKEA